MRAYEIDQSKCKLCLKCMQICPIHAVELRQGQVLVDKSRCVDCGLCCRNCNHEAIYWEDQTAKVEALLAARRKVIFSFDPALRALLPQGVSLEKLAGAAAQMGVLQCADAAAAMEAVASEYGRLIRQKHGENLILTHCPVIRNLVEQHWPELLEDLIPTASPMIAHGRLLKRDCPSAAVVYVTACGAHSQEMRDVRHSTEINAVLTWPQFLRWLHRGGVDPAACDEAPLLGGPGGKGVLGVLPGGMLELLRDYADTGDYRCLSVSGMDQCKAAIKALRNRQLGRCIVDMCACEGGCIGGAAGGLDMAACYAAGLPLGIAASAEPPAAPDVHGVALSTPAIDRFGTPFSPGEDQIQAMLAHIGVGNLHKQADCGRCGFRTCRDRAMAILWGRENVNLCINAVEEAMKGVYRQLYDSLPMAAVLVDDSQKVVGLNREAASLFGVREDQEKYIFELMDPGDFQYVLSTGLAIRSRRMDIPEIFMRVEADLVPLRELNMVLGLFRDITEEEQRETQLQASRLQSVERAQKVIEKQMTVAQQIAFLLGETTAETKVTLNQLKSRLLEEEIP